MEQTISLDTNSSSTSQEFRYILLHPKVRYRVHKGPPHVPIMSHINLVQALPYPVSWRSILILSSHIRLGVVSRFFSSGLPTKTLYLPFISCACYMQRPFHSWFYDWSNIWWEAEIMKLMNVIIRAKIRITCSLFTQGPKDAYSICGIIGLYLREPLLMLALQVWPHVKIDCHAVGRTSKHFQGSESKEVSPLGLTQTHIQINYVIGLYLKFGNN